MGAPGGLACTTCHHEANYDPAGVPGNPKWSLAPVEMAWQGKTLGQMVAGERVLADLEELRASVIEPAMRTASARFFSMLAAQCSQVRA